jgi:hypothetical protein
MPPPLFQGNCQYTALTTAGTTTLNTGQPAGPANPAMFGVLYGAVIAPGTTFAVTFLDVIQPTTIGTNTATVTNTLMSGTGSAGQLFTPAPAGVGVRYRGALVAVTTGTPGIINALWD